MKQIGIVIIGLLILAGVILVLPKNKKYSFDQHPNLPSTTYNLPTTTLFFAGDIMLSRNVAAKMYAANDFTLPFKNVAEVTSSADIAFANLESPFLDKGNHSTQGTLIFNADPKSIAGINYAGFDALSTANNHAFDQGLPGIDYTINLLKQNHILPIGTFETADKLKSVGEQNVIQKNKINFGFLSYTYGVQNNGNKSTSPNVSDLNNLMQLKQDIQTLKGHYADIVIINMHAGTEYTREPTEKQIGFAHAAIDDGADLVIGEHPHWIQPPEQYKGKWIFYSLGNFVFDQMWSQDTREGLAVEVTFGPQPHPALVAGSNQASAEIEKIELKPVIIDNYCCPRWANDDETKNILTKINLTDSILFPHN